MALAATEPQLKTAVLAATAVAATGKVWGQILFAKNDAQYKAWYVDSNNKGNVWFVRRITGTSEWGGVPQEKISETHAYELRYFRPYQHPENVEIDTETAFQAEIETVRAAIDTNVHFGFDAGVNHGGLQFGQPMPAIGVLGNYEGHMAVGVVTITVAEC